MADIRCPQCGTTNPAGSVTCRSCHARLSPQEDMPDWLSDLRAGSSESSPSAESPAEQPDAVPGEQPDWLARIRGNQPKESAGEDDWLKQFSSSENSAPEESAPDWLNGLRAESASESSPEPAAGEDGPDWLKGFQSETSSPSAGSSGSAEEDDWLKSFQSSEPTPTAPQEESQDWMKSFRSESTPAPEEATPSAGDDWLKSFQAESSAAPETPAPSADDNDWLKSFQSESSATEPAPSAGDEKDWLKSFQSDLPTKPAAQEPTPAGDDWLKNLQASYPGDEQPTEAMPTDERPANGETPDWLNNAQSVAQPAEPTPPSPPDWLSGPAGTPPEAAATPSEEPAGPAPVIPDWMTNWGAVPPSNGVQAAPPPAANDTPDWLQSQGAGTSGPAQSAGGLPDWLSSIPAEPPAQAEASGGLPEWLNSLPGDEAQPAENAQPEQPVPFTFDNQPPASGEEPPAPASPFVETGITPAEPVQEPPDWLKAFASNLPTEKESAAPVPPEASLPAATPFEAADLPDWLGSAENPSAPLEEEAIPTEAPEGEGNLEEAQLPGWLQAMRPVEAVVPQGSSSAGSQPGKIEKSGPLAGLVNALPGEDLVTQVRKPPAYSSKLQVSERQRQAADLIEQMLSEEVRPQPPRPARSRVPERATRAIIAIVLVAVLFLPLLAGTGIMPLPGLFPPETVAFHSLLANLPENTPVLLAVDYEPGLSGELSLAASPVMDQLAAHKARAVVLSTVPTGPALAESLLATPRQKGLQVVDLGFLPGGTAGLQELALRPRLTMRYTVSGQEAWTDANGLAGVDSLQKFGAVIVLTENAETARAWIEQVQPSLGPVPLLFVSSAQSAPMIQPYLDSDQVKGLVSGMAGGVMYARIGQTGGVGAGYWDAYQFGLFAGVILILLGGVVQLFAVLIRRPAGKRRA